jgi:cholest-4-en-3-one 26-monooxygenase
MTTTPTALPDLTDLDTFQYGDPYEAWRIMRREAPVHWHERSWGKGFWSVTRYEDLIDVSIDPHTFVSSQGIILDNDGIRTKRERRLEEQGGMMLDARGRMLIMSDPPRHTDLRQVVNKHFTRKGVAYLEASTRKTVTRILDEVSERGECDFVMDISRKLPLEVICEMLGIDRAFSSKVLCILKPVTSL